MGRRGVWLLVGVAVLLSVAGGSSARWLTWDDEIARGSAHRDLGRPVPMRPGAVLTLRDTARHWARRCDAVPSSPGSLFKTRLDAVARLSCPKPAADVSDVVLYRFATADALEADWGDVERFFPRAKGSCTGGPGNGYWADREGHRRGRIACGRTDTEAYVFWNDEARRERYVVSADRLTTAERWWAAHVRPQGAYPTPEERSLLRLVKETVHVDPTTCHRTTQGSPASTASVYCSGGQTTAGKELAADYVFFERFATVRETRARIQRDADQNAPSTRYDGKHETFAGKAATSYSLWRSSDGVRRGDLLQFTTFDTTGISWVAWTYEPRKLYSAVGRSDQDSARTLAAARHL